MGTIKQNQDLEMTWTIDTSNDTYILGETAQITTVGSSAINVVWGNNNDNIILKGDVRASDTNRVVNIEGNGHHLQVAKTSHIDGTDANIGVYSNGANFTMANAGKIEGDSSAVVVDDFSEIKNSGKILSAQVGISSGEGLQLTNSGKVEGDVYGVLADSAGTVINNLQDGRITSAGTAIHLMDGGDALIKNAGLIKGVNAINDGDGDSEIINKGTIEGNVNLGEGDDVFNTRAGTFNGVVNGGDGDDTYVIGKASVQIAEQPGFGSDTVKSTVSYTLGANLEDLVLQGLKDLKGTGNEGNNELTGNKGDNVLKGMDGEDQLIGGKGNDRLFGGAGEDIFDFRKGTGHDVVEDFVNGEDVIFTPFAADEGDLLANHLIQKKGGVLLSYGDDSLFIKGATLAELDENDFFTV
jgi:Ca2+-binding RTX toxin-like protein